MWAFPLVDKTRKKWALLCGIKNERMLLVQNVGLVFTYDSVCPS